MQDLIRQVNSLPLLIKVLLCIPAIDVFYSICRLINGIVKNDVLWIILGLLTIVPGAFFMWIIDLIWVLTKGHALMLGDELLG